MVSTFVSESLAALHPPLRWKEELGIVPDLHPHLCATAHWELTPNSAVAHILVVWTGENFLRLAQDNRLAAELERVRSALSTLIPNGSAAPDWLVSASAVQRLTFAVLSDSLNAVSRTIAHAQLELGVTIRHMRHGEMVDTLTTYALALEPTRQAPREERFLCGLDPRAVRFNQGAQKTLSGAWLAALRQVLAESQAKAVHRAFPTFRRLYELCKDESAAEAALAELRLGRRRRSGTEGSQRFGPAKSRKVISVMRCYESLPSDPGAKASNAGAIEQLAMETAVGTTAASGDAVGASSTHASKPSSMHAHQHGLAASRQQISGAIRLPATAAYDSIDESSGAAERSSATATSIRVHGMHGMQETHMDVNGHHAAIVGIRQHSNNDNSLASIGSTEPGLRQLYGETAEVGCRDLWDEEDEWRRQECALDVEHDDGYLDAASSEDEGVAQLSEVLDDEQKRAASLRWSDNEQSCECSNPHLENRISEGNCGSRRVSTLHLYTSSTQPRLNDGRLRHSYVRTVHLEEVVGTGNSAKSDDGSVSDDSEISLFDQACSQMGVHRTSSSRSYSCGIEGTMNLAVRVEPTPETRGATMAAPPCSMVSQAVSESIVPAPCFVDRAVDELHPDAPGLTVVEGASRLSSHLMSEPSSHLMSEPFEVCIGGAVGDEMDADSDSATELDPDELPELYRLCSASRTTGANGMAMASTMWESPGPRPSEKDLSESEEDCGEPESHTGLSQAMHDVDVACEEGNFEDGDSNNDDEPGAHSLLIPEPSGAASDTAVPDASERRLSQRTPTLRKHLLVGIETMRRRATNPVYPSRFF